MQTGKEESPGPSVHKLLDKINNRKISFVHNTCVKTDYDRKPVDKLGSAAASMANMTPEQADECAELFKEKRNVVHAQKDTQLREDRELIEYLKKVREQTLGMPADTTHLALPISALSAFPALPDCPPIDCPPTRGVNDGEPDLGCDALADKLTRVGASSYMVDDLPITTKSNPDNPPVWLPKVDYLDEIDYNCGREAEFVPGGQTSGTLDPPECRGATVKCPPKKADCPPTKPECYKPRLCPPTCDPCKPETCCPVSCFPTYPCPPPCDPCSVPCPPPCDPCCVPCPPPCDPCCTPYLPPCNPCCVPCPPPCDPCCVPCPPPCDPCCVPCPPPCDPCCVPCPPPCDPCCPPPRRQPCDPCYPPPCDPCCPTPCPPPCPPPCDPCCPPPCDPCCPPVCNPCVPCAPVCVPTCEPSFSCVPCNPCAPCSPCPPCPPRCDPCCPPCPPPCDPCCDPCPKICDPCCQITCGPSLPNPKIKGVLMKPCLPKVQPDPCCNPCAPKWCYNPCDPVCNKYICYPNNTCLPRRLRALDLCGVDCTPYESPVCSPVICSKLPSCYLRDYRLRFRKTLPKPNQDFEFIDEEGRRLHKMRDSDGRTTLGLMCLQSTAFRACC